jgi:hypothetical protein
MTFSGGKANPRGCTLRVSLHLPTAALHLRFLPVGLLPPRPFYTSAYVTRVFAQRSCSQQHWLPSLCLRWVENPWPPGELRLLPEATLPGDTLRYPSAPASTRDSKLLIFVV